MLDSLRRTAGLVLATAVALGAAGCGEREGSGARPDGRVRSVASLAEGRGGAQAPGIEPIARFKLPAPALSLAVSGGALYASMSTKGLAVVDLSDPTSPRLVRQLVGMRRPDDPEGRVFLMVLPEENRLLVADRLRGLSVYDAADPLNPQFQWAIRIPGGNNNQPVSIRRVGEHYYLACGGGGLLALPADFGPQSKPKALLAQFDYTRGVTPYGSSWLLTADGYDTGMQVLDIEDPERPRLAHVFQTGSFTDQVIALEGYAVVSNRAQGFAVIDLSDPGRPFLAAYHYTPRAAGSMIKAIELWRGRYLLAGNRAGRIDVYDLADPARPRHVLRHEVHTQVNALALEGDLLYAGLWDESEVGVFELSDPGEGTRSASRAER